MKKTILIFVLFVAFYSKFIYAQQYVVEPVITGLALPVSFSFLPGNNVIITQQQGLAVIYSLNNTFISNFWNFNDSLIFGSERGLIGVCLDPNYISNHYIYFYYTHNPLTYRVVRLTENNNFGTNPRIIFSETVTSMNSAHVGGCIKFGPGNKLYIMIGENNVPANAQSLTTFKGKILRINSDGTIPADNPFYDDGNPATGNDDRIWSYGHRNSIGMCFSPYNDSLYESENMGGTPDEINFIRKGKNYGWPACQGSCNPYNPLYRDPIGELPGNGSANFAPTGIMIYTSSIMPEFTGRLFVVGYGLGNLYRGLIKCDLGNPPFYDTIITKTIIVDWYAYTDLAQGSDGFIYGLHFSSPAALNRLCLNPNAINNQNYPVNFSLSQNYPNPFNPTTSIKYEIPKSSFVSLKIFNVLGVEIASLVNETKQQGSYDVSWDASSYPSGVYFYEMQSGGFTERKKMVLIK